MNAFALLADGIDWGKIAAELPVVIVCLTACYGVYQIMNRIRAEQIAELKDAWGKMEARLLAEIEDLKSERTTLRGQITKLRNELDDKGKAAGQ